MTWGVRISAAALAACNFCCCAAIAQDASFQVLRTPWQINSSSFNWIRSDGEAVVGVSDYRITRWTRFGGFENLGAGIGYFGAETSGAVAAGSGGFPGQLYYVTELGENELICTNCASSPSAFSSDGRLVVYVYDVSGGEGFLQGVVYNHETSQTTPFAFNLPTAISASTMEAVGFNQQWGGGTSGPSYLRTDGIWALNWGWYGVSGSALSKSGQVVAGLRWDTANSPARIFTLTDNLHWRTYAATAFQNGLPKPTRISDNGQSMLLAQKVASETFFYLWTPTRGTREITELVVPLDILPDGWQFITVADMTPDGLSFTGSGRGLDGQEVGFLMTLPAPCTADIDWSWFVDLEDFELFVHLFEAGDQRADVDGSGFVDFDDFTTFVIAFENGC